jgi:hypothetical protein
MSDLERFLARLGEDLNAIELELSDNFPRKIGDGRQYVHGIIVNTGSEDAVLKLFFRNNSQITTTLNAGQALELQSIPLSQIQNVQSSQNPNVVAYLATSSTILGTPRISVVGAPSVQNVSFNGVAQPVDVNAVNYSNVVNGAIQYFEGTITGNGVILFFSSASSNNGWTDIVTASTTVINVASLSGTSPSVTFQLYAVVGSNQSGNSSYIASPSSNLVSYNGWYLAPLPNASTGSISAAGVYTLSTTTPLLGIAVYATVGGTSPSISINATLTVSVV